MTLHGHTRIELTDVHTRTLVLGPLQDGGAEITKEEPK